MSAQTLERELQTGRLVILSLQTFPVLRLWFMVHLRHKRLTPAAEALRCLLLSGDPQRALAPAARARRGTRSQRKAAA
ncbi:MAG: hypothetical protein NZL99_09505 [Burkholderiaceae bacterium]|nr:hypothetical protein [Burkholderiaceae bacterium]MCX7902579.1 hypothetical protein [Burkholderiaceae bacterium]